MAILAALFIILWYISIVGLEHLFQRFEEDEKSTFLFSAILNIH
jgi:hypothetical protein